MAARRSVKTPSKHQAKAEPKPPEPSAPVPNPPQAQPPAGFSAAVARAVHIGNALNLIDMVERGTFSSTRKVAVRKAILEALLEEL